MDRPPLRDMSNLPSEIKTNLDRVANTGKIEVPLATYNLIVDQIAVMQRVVGLHHGEVTRIGEENRKLQLQVMSMESRLATTETAIVSLNSNVISMRPQIDNNTRNINWNLQYLPEANTSLDPSQP
jgi:hypothetical protein